MSFTWAFSLPLVHPLFFLTTETKLPASSFSSCHAFLTIQNCALKLYAQIHSFLQLFSWYIFTQVRKVTNNSRLKKKVQYSELKRNTRWGFINSDVTFSRFLSCLKRGLYMGRPLWLWIMETAFLTQNNPYALLLIPSFCGRVASLVYRGRRFV